eukprot:PhF_6_TR19628/c0_g1_i1/m.28640
MDNTQRAILIGACLVLYFLSVYHRERSPLTNLRSSPHPPKKWKPPFQFGNDAWIVYAQLQPRRTWPTLLLEINGKEYLSDELKKAVEAVAYNPKSVHTSEGAEARKWLEIYFSRKHASSWIDLLRQSQGDVNIFPRVSCNETVSMLSVECYVLYGNHYLSKGDNTRSTSAFERAVSLCNKLLPNAECDKVYLHLGMVFKSMGWTAKAIHLLKQCVQRSQSSEDMSLESDCSMALGDSLLQDGDLKVGLQYLQRSLNIELFRRSCLWSARTRQLAMKLAYMHLRYGRCREAEPFLEMIQTLGYECSNSYETWRAKLHAFKCIVLNGPREKSVSILHLVDKDVLTHTQQVEGFKVVAQVMEHFEMHEAALRYYYDARTASDFINAPHVTQMLSNKILQLVFKLNAPSTQIDAEVVRAISDWKRSY